MALVLLGGPQPSLFCHVWCAERDASTVTCHDHESAITRLASGRTCAPGSSDRGSFVREDLRPLANPLSEFTAAFVAAVSANPHIELVRHSHDRASPFGPLSTTILRI